jgi:hypothetical protein
MAYLLVAVVFIIVISFLSYKAGYEDGRHDEYMRLTIKRRRERVEEL